MKKQKKTILITGANFSNKGAEAMLEATVRALALHFPDYTPILLDMFPIFTGEKKEANPFKILNMHVTSLIRINFPLLKLFIKRRTISDDEALIIKTFNSATAVMDLSGYGLSSHNQDLLWSIAYLLPIRMAKKQCIPVWLLPQSIGPFAFKGIKKILFSLFAISLLKYPEIIFARESDGLNAVSPLREKPTFLSSDIVLLSPAPKDSSGKLSEPSDVVVIPNRQLFRMLPQNEVLDIYESLIRSALKHQLSIHIIQHSHDDKEFCSLLKTRIDNKALQIDADVMPLADLTSTISQSRFVISGRYHGAVHALKSNRPVIILGWAEKYRSLASRFKLNDYLIDLSTKLKPVNLPDLITDLLSHEVKLKQEIAKTLLDIEKESLWKKILLPK